MVVNLGKKNSKGTLTIEACIAYTCFAMIMFTLLFLIKIIYTYGVVQHAINQVAKEFASYSYLYSVTLGDVDSTLAEATAAGKANFNKTADDLATTFNAATSLMESAKSTAGATQSGDVDSIVSGLQSTLGSGQDFMDSLPATREALGGIISDPKKAFMSLVGVLASSTAENSKTLIFGEIIRTMSAEYIDVNSGTVAGANDRLEKLRVIGGLNGLDFSASRFFPNGTMDIDIVVCYSLEPLMPLKVLPDLNLVNRIYIRGWGSGSGTSSTGGATSSSIWNDVNDINRGVVLQKKAGLRNLPNSFPVFSKFENGVATSSMSVDLRANTYQDQSKLDSLVLSRCKKIDEYKDTKNAGTTLNNSDISQRELVIMIPPSSVGTGEEDKSRLNQAIALARERFPDINIVVIEVDVESAE